MKSANDVVLKLLGILLLAAAVLKGWHLLTTPVANNDVWTSRLFLITQVEFELALGIWFLSSLFKKAAWLTGLVCFSVFSVIALYKGISGAESCGCFGKIHVNPWITLLAIDLPAVISLGLFQPNLKEKFLTPLPSPARFATIYGLLVVVLGASTAVLAFNQPEKVTVSYEVLEPKEWVGKTLPIIDHIDIAQQLQQGMWVVMIYHYDCPHCAEAIPRYERMARDLAGNGNFLKIALIEVPPYGNSPVSQNSPCFRGRMDNSKAWFVTTPAVAFMIDGQVRATWEEEAPDFKTILEEITETDEK